MVQLFEIYHATQEGCIFFWNMYNDLRKVMGVVPGCTLLVGNVIVINLMSFLCIHCPI